MSAKSSSPRELKRSYSAALRTGAGTDSSIAAAIVQRPSPESDTRPANFARSGLSSSATGGQVQQPRGDDAAAPPDLGDVGQVQVVLVVLGVAQRRGFGIDGALLLAGVGVAEDIQPLRVGGHDAVLDAVVDHLDEVARAARTAVQVAVLGGAAYLLPTGRARRRLDTWGQGGENGVEALDDGFLAADHQAVAPLRPPDPAAGPDVHIVDALGFQLGGAADVIVVIGVAAVDDHVVAFEQWDKRLQRRIDHRRRHHHPDRAGLFQLVREVLERRCPDGPSLTSACTASGWRS